MIDYELFCKIKHLNVQEKLSATQIASELALDPRTVRSWLSQARFSQRKSSPRSSKLDPFKADIARMLENQPLHSQSSPAAHTEKQGCRILIFDYKIKSLDATPNFPTKTSAALPLNQIPMQFETDRIETFSRRR